MSEQNQKSNIFFSKPPPNYTSKPIQNQNQPWHLFGQSSRAGAPPPLHEVKIMNSKNKNTNETGVTKLEFLNLKDKAKDDDDVIPLPLAQQVPRLPPRNQPVIALPTIGLSKIPQTQIEIELSDSSDSDTICISTDEEGEIVSDTDADTSLANSRHGNKDEDEIEIIGVHINKESPTYIKNKKLQKKRKRQKQKKLEMKAKNGQQQPVQRKHGETPRIQIQRRKSLKRIGQGTGTGVGGNKFISVNRARYNATTPKSLLKKLISRNPRRQNYVQPSKIREKYSKLHDISFTPQGYPKPRIITWTTNDNKNSSINLIPRNRKAINNENFDSLSRGFNNLNFRQNTSPPRATSTKNIIQQQQQQKNVNSFMNRKRSLRSPTKFQNKWPTSYVPPGTSCDNTKGQLRPIIIDASNIAMQHGRKYMVPGSTGKPPFSCKGIEHCVNYFKQRGHAKVMAFVPAFRKEVKSSKDTHILFKLERDNNLFCTPSRKVNEKQICSYDDRFILQIATQLDGIVVSCDNYKDLFEESPELRPVIEKRLLPFVWVDDILMFPPDPLGPNGPKLDDFLRF